MYICKLASFYLNTRHRFNSYWWDPHFLGESHWFWVLFGIDSQVALFYFKFEFDIPPVSILIWLSQPFSGMLALWGKKGLMTWEILFSVGKITFSFPYCIRTESEGSWKAEVMWKHHGTNNLGNERMVCSKMLLCNLDQKKIFWGA